MQANTNNYNQLDILNRRMQEEEEEENKSPNFSQFRNLASFDSVIDKNYKSHFMKKNT